MIANMLQGIMQSASESESDDDEQSDEDEAKKPATSDKQKRSSRGETVEGRTFHRQHSDGSPRTGDDDDHEAREPRNPGRQSSTTRTK